MVIHELRAPLQTITADVEFLEASSQGRFDDVFARFHRSLGAIAGRLRNVAEFARLSEAPLPTSSDVVNLRDFLASSIDEHRAEADARSQCLVGDFEFDLELTVRLDAIRLHQILENYLANAIQHSHPGAPVTVAARLADQPGPRGWELTVTVRDNGPGVAPSMTEVLWEPFWTTKSTAASSGLGLTIVRLLAEAAGWDVGYGPTNRGGAGFHVRLPVDDVAR